MKFSLSIILSLAFTVSLSQPYFRHCTDFTDSTNSAFVHEIEPLGVMLLRGYLRGELKAYIFDVKSQDVKWEPIPSEHLPDQWDPKMDYYMEEMVSYQGKFYVARQDTWARRGETPDKSDSWAVTQLLGDVVSTIHSFPTPHDSLTKQDLLRAFVEYPEEYMAGQWDATAEYWGGHTVWFQGEFYECGMDHLGGKRPDLEPDYWFRIEPHITFHLPDELSIACILYADDRNNANRLVPQMLSLFYLDDMRGRWKNPGLNFYYNDAVDYMAGQKQQPLLCRADLGYVGAPQLLLGYENFTNVLGLVQANLGGALKPGKKDIVDAAKFNAFVKAASTELQSGTWSLVQDMISNDMWLTESQRSSKEILTTHVARIKWQSMEKVLKAAQPPPRRWTYLEWLREGALHGTLDSARIDTLDAMPARPIDPLLSSDTYFVEERFAGTTNNAALAGAMTKIWPLLQQALDADQVRLQPRATRLFLCDQPFPRITLVSDDRDWKLDNGFTLESPNGPELDPAVIADPVGGISIQYKRQVTIQKSKAAEFEPVKVAVCFFQPVSQAYAEYYFVWEDVLKVAAGRDDLRELVESVKEGTMIFDSTEVVYGLVGVR